MMILFVRIPKSGLYFLEALICFRGLFEIPDTVAISEVGPLFEAHGT